MTIILIGYMGSGKTTVGKNLSRVLDSDFVDLDAYIEDKEGKSIQELFKAKGEIYFRKIENQYLVEVLSLEKAIVSLGGGTPCYGKNMQAINANNSKSIYLKASIPTLTDRIFKERTTRPLIAHIKTESELKEFIGKHLFERSIFYSQSNFTITVDHKSVSKIVEEIVMELF